MPLHTMTIMGTRPEAVKLAPVVLALEQASDLDVSLVTTGQHRDMLDHVIDEFELSVTATLDIFDHGLSLAEMTSRIVTRVADALDEMRPDLVLVQGDTTSAFVGGLAAFYVGIPVVHLEAGLRTHDLQQPFPEEMNRRLLGQVADLHLAPTVNAKTNLLRESVGGAIVVTGNTVIDAFLQVASRPCPPVPPVLEHVFSSDRPIVVVTAHRRESWTTAMNDIAGAVAELATRYPEVYFVVPLHRNPVVGGTLRPIIGDRDNVILTEPLPYGLFVHTIKRSTMLLTDSGGLQEEAPALGKPVLVLRNKTERPEGVMAGTVAVAGTSMQGIVELTAAILDDADRYRAMAGTANPYGDGHAAPRAMAAIRWRYLDGPRPEEFVASPASKPLVFDSREP